MRKFVPYRRKTEGKTHYGKRLKLLLSKKPRLVVRNFNKNTIVQIIEYNQKGDKVVTCSSSRELIKLGWKGARGNLPSAYLTGLLCGVKAKKKNVKEAVLDIGMQQSVKGSKIYAALKGALDAGIKIAHSKEVLPSEERIMGQHIASYAKMLAAKRESYEKQFGEYLKKGFDLENFKKHVEDVKNKILKS